MNFAAFHAFDDNTLLIARCCPKYFISFADGMQSQLSGSHILKDHEILQLDSLQSELSILACKLFEYRLAMEYAPIDILKKIQLVSGTLNIVKEDANS